MQQYSLADLKRLFGLSPALIRKLSRAGFITQPAPRGKSSYTFQELLVLRVAGALKAAVEGRSRFGGVTATLKRLA